MVDAARRDFVEKCGLPETEFFADSFVSMADLARTGSL
jgi:CDP-4-dehydro-6-deoxyglucose reductase